jgi:hypothetical protein
MRGKKASLKPSVQRRPQSIEKSVAVEETSFDDAPPQRSTEEERWIDDMAVLRRAAEELAERRLAARSSKPQRKEELRTRYRSNPERANTAREAGLVVEERSVENDAWVDDIAVLRRGAEQVAQKRLATRLAVSTGAPDNAFHTLLEAFGYSSQRQRNEELRTLYHNNPERVASFLKIALREGSAEQRQIIAAELLASGLVDEAINNLARSKDKESYSAFSLLFLAAKSGVIQPLVTVIERHASVELRLKLIGVLVSSGAPEVLPAFRRLAASNALSFQLRSAVVDGINQLNIQVRETAWPIRSHDFERIWNSGFAQTATEIYPKLDAV